MVNDPRDLAHTLIAPPPPPPGLEAVRDDLGDADVITLLAARETAAAAVARGRLEAAPAAEHAALATALGRLAEVLRSPLDPAPPPMTAGRRAWAEEQLNPIAAAHGPVGVVRLLAALAERDAAGALPGSGARQVAALRVRVLRAFTAQADHRPWTPAGGGRDDPDRRAWSGHRPRTRSSR